MKRWSVTELIKQVTDQKIFGWQWAKSQEFATLANYLYPPEQILGLLVCRYQNQPTLVVLTSQRLFLIRQTGLTTMKVDQLGLEAFQEWKSQIYGSLTQLDLTFRTQTVYQLKEIEKEVGETFVSLFIQACQNWQQQRDKV